SAGASAAGRGRMDEPVRTSTDGPYSDRDPFDWLGALLGPRVDELRALLDELAARWRGGAGGGGEGARHPPRGPFRQLGPRTASAISSASWASSRATTGTSSSSASHNSSIDCGCSRTRSRDRGAPDDQAGRRAPRGARGARGPAAHRGRRRDQEGT